MRAARTTRIALVITDLVTIGFIALAFAHFLLQPGLPIEYRSPDAVLTVDGRPVFREDTGVEFSIARHAIGDTVLITSPQYTHPVPVVIERFSPLHQILLVTLMSCLFVALGFLATYFKKDDVTAVIFHFSAVATAVALIGQKSIAAFCVPWLGLAGFIFFFPLFALVGVLLFHFSIVFPVPRDEPIRRAFKPIYAAVVVYAGICAWMYLNALNEWTGAAYGRFAGYYRVLIGSMFLFFIAAMVRFGYSYRRAGSVTEKKKLRWVFFGSFVGIAPFFFFWTLPSILGFPPLVDEILFQVFLICIPVSFTIAIVRYRAFDIDVIINRSTVYSIAVVLIVALYAAVVLATQVVLVAVSSGTSPLVSRDVLSAMQAVLIALLFNPTRSRVQSFVDQYFFRVQYNYRESQRRLTDQIRGCTNVQVLAGSIVEEVRKIWHPEPAAFLIRESDGGAFRVAASVGPSLLSMASGNVAENLIASASRSIVARQRDVVPGIQHANLESIIPEASSDVAIVAPIVSEKGEQCAALTIGRKKSGQRYTVEDIDLLHTITAEAAAMMHRLSLQEKILMEQLELQRLEEQNRLKSLFVSGVSHDLKTPLTAIKLFAELLENPDAMQPAQYHEYLSIIGGETDRLTRLIDNVLDFSRIERGSDEYRFAPVDVNRVIERTVSVVSYHCTHEQVDLTVDLSEGVPVIEADGDALQRAFLNVITNAIKYSRAPKRIAVTSGHDDAFVTVSIADNGIGIASDKLRYIFDPFYQVKDPAAAQASGVGLGLSIVKRIIEKHRGSVIVDSTVGEGTTFRFHFPIMLSEAEAPDE